MLIAIGIGAVLGAVDPALGIAMQPLGTVFIKMIRAVIGLVIFFTVVAGIGRMEAMSKVGRLGGVALIYFLALSTFALLVGLVAGNRRNPVLALTSILTHSMPRQSPAMPARPRR